MASISEMESPDTKEPWTPSTFDAKQLATQTRVQQTDRPFWTVLSTEASKKNELAFCDEVVSEWQIKDLEDRRCGEECGVGVFMASVCAMWFPLSRS